MRRNGVEQQEQGFEFPTRHAAGGNHLIHQRHHLRDGGVVLHGFVIQRNLLNRLMHERVQLLAVPLVGRHVLLQAPHTVKEAAAALRALRAPRNRLIERAHEHLVHAESVRANFINNVIRIDDVAARLGHLLAVLAKNHAVAGALLVGFRRGNHANVMQEQMPETAVQQMQGRVLHAAVVPVHGQPIAKRFGRGNGCFAVRVAVAHEVPA